MVLYIQMKRYNPTQIEPKWQKTWQSTGIYQADDASNKSKNYILDFFPYPSGAAMHVGHVRNYTISDVLARYARMRGDNVLHPMGWDAFGLPAENYAIKTGVSPQVAVAQNTEKFKQQLMQMGIGIDWSREINSTDPSYYKWTQWFFTLLFERGLAYQKESLQWWCDTDKTVLANEQVEAGKCWRCGNEVTKKPLKQWFFKITDYADRLVDDLDDLDWSEAIKSMQRNWIGRSIGAQISFKVDGDTRAVDVFTTRADTIFGATFLVLAPEHKLVDVITTQEQKAAVAKYKKAAQAKSDIERQETNRTKTGVFTGAYAINPANDKKIPIWIADYVLTGYGTGAIMAVPAHDDRDHAFAKKFKLPVTPVVTPAFYDYLHDATDRQSVNVVAHDPKTNLYCVLDWKNPNFGLGWPGGGIDADETLAEAAAREFAEETGYTDFTVDEILPVATSSYMLSGGYVPKQRSVRGIAKVTVHSMQNDGLAHQDGYEKDAYNVLWLPAEEILAGMQKEWKAIAEFALGGTIHVGEGVMINSGAYNNLQTEIAREKIVADLEEKGVAELRTNYKIRDWLISRQRYWGAPIPIVHCAKDGAVAVPADQLPIELPEMKSYEPSGDGRSPLARVPEWVNTTCPKCDGPATRETDTMDGFACSSWYFLRFADPNNADTPFSREAADRWLPVDTYVGGAEHAVMHLLYARFWTKVMYDAGLIGFTEPFTALRNQGMLLAPDGRKMSKSWGNVIAPDELIANGYGADSIRVMEMFIGPWNQSANWSTEGLGGCHRFLQRIWTISQEYFAGDTLLQNAEHELQIRRATHKTIKKVTQDLQDMGFNTAIAALMQFVNDLYKIKVDLAPNVQNEAWREAISALAQLVAPFAPHMSEELWQQLGNSTSVHVSAWPIWDESLVAEELLTIVVQVNGKLRANLMVAADASEEEITAQATSHERVQEFLHGKPPKRVIVVPGRLVNIVI